MDNKTDQKVRLDKWLWSARFFKTRGLAKTAIDGGKVHYQGQRTKSSRMVELGATLTIRQGWGEKEVRVTGLSEQRRGAKEAVLLYQETPASLAKREAETANRKILSGNASLNRPNKKERRDQAKLLNRLGQGL